MNYLLFFSILDLVLISRLRLTMRDQGIGEKQDLLFMIIIPLFILPFLSLNFTWFILAGYLLLIRPFIIHSLEKNTKNLNRNRIIMLAITVVIAAFLASPLFHLQTAAWVDGAKDILFRVFIPEGEPSAFQWIRLYILLFGFLMILNETNIVIRYTLEKLGLAPLGNSHQEVINKEQFRTGRVIGFLERIFVFLFVLLSQYTAIGFIIAAKGIVRYPDFGKRSFTEYILIGTLLSVLFSMLIAYIVLLFIR